jgi:tyrosyl-tRNA synthetase
MTLSEELAWRGFAYQTTYKDPTALDGDPVTFYWGVDPSSDSMTIGNLAAAMMVKLFMKHGHRAVLLVGGATGLIGDPDGKAEERGLKTPEEINRNAENIANQYKQLFSGQSFDIVNNHDWFRDMRYIDFLRDVGKHVPMRQMLGREFIQTRLGEEGSGISYAEFSYVLIQAYDFLRLYEDKGVRLQVCGSDQWGNSVAGVDLIRRKTGGEANVYSAPLVVNKATGKKFGKSEEGAVWLSAAKTTPTQFYQFWVNSDDADVESFLKIFTELSKDEIEGIMAEQERDPGARSAQHRLAETVTELVHGTGATQTARATTDVLVGKTAIDEVDETILQNIRKEVPAAKASETGSLVDALVAAGLADSNTEARRLIAGNAISVNGQRVSREAFEAGDFRNGRLLIRRGKAFKDSALVELA